MERVRVGIVGAGFMGTSHFGVYQSHPNGEVVALADIDERKLKGDWSAVVGNIGEQDYSDPVDLSGIAAYKGATELIDDPAVDLVDICVPTPYHHELVLQALKRGKHVLCEKPLARTKGQAAEIARAATAAGSFFTAGMCVRYWPEYDYLRTLLKENRLGPVRAASFKRLSPTVQGNSWNDWFLDASMSGGAILDLHLHDTDIVLAYFGRPERVQSQGISGFRSDSGVDHVMTRYHFGDDRLIMAEGGWSASKGVPFEMSFLVVGEQGSARLSEQGFGVYYEDGTVDHPDLSDPAGPTGWHREMDAAINAILSGKRETDRITLQEMVDAIAIVEAETESVRAGRAVTVAYTDI